MLLLTLRNAAILLAECHYVSWFMFVCVCLFLPCFSFPLQHCTEAHPWFTWTFVVSCIFIITSSSLVLILCVTQPGACTGFLTYMRVLCSSGERPFCCKLCPYRASQKGNLKTHVQSVHHMPFDNSQYLNTRSLLLSQETLETLAAKHQATPQQQ